MKCFLTVHTALPVIADKGWQGRLSVFDRSPSQCVRTVLAVLPVIADTRLARAAVSDCCESCGCTRMSPEAIYRTATATAIFSCLSLEKKENTTQPSHVIKETQPSQEKTSTQNTQLFLKRKTHFSQRKKLAIEQSIKLSQAKKNNNILCYSIDGKFNSLQKKNKLNSLKGKNNTLKKKKKQLSQGRSSTLMKKLNSHLQKKEINTKLREKNSTVSRKWWSQLSHEKNQRTQEKNLDPPNSFTRKRTSNFEKINSLTWKENLNPLKTTNSTFSR